MGLETTRLFDKKLSNFVQENEIRHLENYILREILWAGFVSSLPGLFGLFTKDLPEFVRRCDKNMVQIIGIETHMDGEYPFHVWCIEEYGEALKGNSWTYECLINIAAAHVERDLVIYIDIPPKNISILRNIYSMYS